MKRILALLLTTMLLSALLPAVGLAEDTVELVFWTRINDTLKTKSPLSKRFIPM